MNRHELSSPESSSQWRLDGSRLLDSPNFARLLMRKLRVGKPPIAAALIAFLRWTSQTLRVINAHCVGASQCLQSSDSSPCKSSSSSSRFLAAVLAWSSNATGSASFTWALTTFFRVAASQAKLFWQKHWLETGRLFCFSWQKSSQTHKKVRCVFGAFDDVLPRSKPSPRRQDELIVAWQTTINGLADCS
jgi:hypothetical protein